MILPSKVDKCVARAVKVGNKVQALILTVGHFELRQTVPDTDRDRILLGYWSLIRDYQAGILGLVQRGHHGSALALVRPLTEAWVRAFLIVSCTVEDLEKIKKDTYSVNFGRVGPEIDKAFGLPIFTTLMRNSRGTHAFTHSSIQQVIRQFNADELIAAYDEKALAETADRAAMAFIWVSSLVAHHFGHLDLAKQIEDEFVSNYSAQQGS